MQHALLTSALHDNAMSLFRHKFDTKFALLVACASEKSFFSVDVLSRLIELKCAGIKSSHIAENYHFDV